MRRFTVDEYHGMIQAGILTEDDPVELLEGWIVWKMPHNPLHDATVDIARELLQGRLPPDWRVRVQSAITLPDSEPEPDLTVVPGPASLYFHRHPGPGDIALLVEVADTSLNRDRNDKGNLYARANIIAYWIVNLVDRHIEVYSNPTGPDPNPVYRQRQDYRPGDNVPLVIDGKEIAQLPVTEFLP
jgi:hypothetical protein